MELRGDSTISASLKHDFVASIPRKASELYSTMWVCPRMVYLCSCFLLAAPRVPIRLDFALHDAATAQTSCNDPFHLAVDWTPQPLPLHLREKSWLLAGWRWWKSWKLGDSGCLLAI